MPGSLFEGRVFAALLFDMDGTILTSIAAAERVWGGWAQSHNLDVAAFIPTIHGVRAIDTVARLNLPGVDAEQEAAAISAAEIADVAGISPIADAVRFLAALPADRWAIVTSAPRALALARLAAAGIAPPQVLITAEDVVRGKPDPEGFRLAAERLGCDIEDCLIFEDAAAGIQAAAATGATVAVVTALHSHVMETPYFKLASFDHLHPSGETAGVRIDRVAA